MNQKVIGKVSANGRFRKMMYTNNRTIILKLSIYSRPFADFLLLMRTMSD
jgi:hypothetical protein